MSVPLGSIVWQRRFLQIRGDADDCVDERSGRADAHGCAHSGLQVEMLGIDSHGRAGDGINRGNLIEAAACGCAIVATDIGGIRDYIQNGITGLLSPPKAPEALAKNLCLLLGNDELRIRLALAANASIRRFNWEQSTDQLEKFMMDDGGCDFPTSPGSESTSRAG